MGKYGEAAEIAVSLLRDGNAVAPRDAWRQAVATVFPGRSESQKKGCPRDSFLALCELGVVESVAAGTYTRSVKNKSYVTRALAALRSDPALADDPRRLWHFATGGADTKPNSQMEVLTALWRRRIIRHGD
ncbi:MAG TPA: hypothetical protein VHG51_06570 [Longimicrobiaceae bacterium]|nr:hypothetical protein [Longimicrobiaceae bacterium]